MPSESVTPRPWYDAWIDAATGRTGFWGRSRPDDHFRTASQSSVFVEAVSELLASGPYADFGTVVEIGAGDGWLLDGLRSRDPDRRFVGVDLRPRPDGLGVDWCTGAWDVRTDSWQSSVADLLGTLPSPTMIICAEWLDDLPCPIVAPTSGGRQGPDWRAVQVGPDGSESLGGPVAEEDARWLQRWWPAVTDGSLPMPRRAESGRTRDSAWATVIRALRRSGGAALMIDYGHLRAARPPAGTLTGFVAGRQVPARPDPAINLTAHVAVDAVAAAGERAGARTSFLIDQRTAVRRFLPDPRPTGPDPLAELQRRGEQRMLTATLGSHYWLLQDVPSP
ncbi:SAM-dependent methyltransferase [Microlunatus soli]|uniref:SAM-dependent methyltransferase, MidA family n=1 Tax=Microlunatus soli TaxID=630515 RepID=A0A1H1SJS1_9ACTN|nr:SAM-dependent methyltransferase [Microlunatus soli]SDS48237.1 SAM-dependent methyltransferase, MidA family [Microlunatus soli]